MKFFVVVSDVNFMPILDYTTRSVEKLKATTYKRMIVTLSVNSNYFLSEIRSYKIDRSNGYKQDSPSDR